MTTVTTCVAQEPRTFFASPTTIIVVAMITAMTFSASGAAPTPLYHLYQDQFGLTPALVTVIFASYVLSLLLALLTTGALSDHVGRRPTVLGVLMMNIIAMVMFITAGSRRVPTTVEALDQLFRRLLRLDSSRIVNRLCKRGRSAPPRWRVCRPVQLSILRPE